MIVLKFGGSSVSSENHLQHIKEILSKKEDNFIVIVSALSGVTDLLTQLGQESLLDNQFDTLSSIKARHFDFIHQIFLPNRQTEVILSIQPLFNTLENICNGVSVLKELTDRTQALIGSFGEQLSSILVHRYLQQEGIELEYLDSRKFIKANKNYLKAIVDFDRTAELIATLNQDRNYIGGGFMATNEDNETVLLGRGGSDYSASIFASCVQAHFIEIWSDVDGIHSANPRIVKNTVSIDQLSYEEAFELAYFGANVLYPPAIQPVMKSKIPLYLKNTSFPNQRGTLISHEKYKSIHKIHGVSSLSDIQILSLTGVGLAHEKGVARKVFQAIELEDVNVILITQSCSEQSICIAVNKEDGAKAKKAIDAVFVNDIKSGLINPIDIAKNHSIIAVVGDSMKHKVGLSGKLFSALGENAVNIVAIAQGSSERNISIVVDAKDEHKAINVIHEKFFSHIVKDIHLFIAGVGNVGSEFLKIIEKQRQVLIDEYEINLKIVAVSNSRKMLVDKSGLKISDISTLNEKGQEMKSFDAFVNHAVEYNLRNTIFIDNTASEVVSQSYQSFLENSITVIACNKIACSSSYEQYQELRLTAKEHNCSFRYETSVGAALPIIKTIHDMRLSGDKIRRIEAVISGSLNFIFNEYKGERAFSEIVMQAKVEGYTEPNPMIDLSGLDVKRKILILARESGLKRELSDIEFNAFLPEACMKASSVDDFFIQLKKHESYFQEMYNKAQSQGHKLKVIASMNDGNMKVELRKISPDSPFYHLEGKDNVIAINTDRYIQEPLVIKGAGAGAAVTASGVFSDLMQVVNKG